jgi:hypothetical protein
VASAFYCCAGTISVSLFARFNMVGCVHDKLELLPERKITLRCRHCHLTLGRDEVGDGFCPECFETSGSKRYEFEEMTGPETGIARYRCEDCGAMIKSS